jgi:hypothetical protein
VLRESREPQAALPDSLGALLLRAAPLLCNVLFLTGVWGYSILEAGVALTPGPLAAAMAAPIGGGSPTVSARGSWPSPAG